LIALLLSAALAAEPASLVPDEGLLASEPAPTALRTLPPDDPLQERLLGEAAAVPPGSPHGVSGSEQSWTWTLALGMAAVGAGLVYAARRHLARREQSPSSVLQIVGRAGLGASQLVLVDVAAAHGTRRRLLIGVGGSAPTLVADLGDDEPELDLAESSSSAPASDHEPEPVVAPSQKKAAVRSLYGQLPGLLPPPVDAAERAARKRSAMALIDEVTRERQAPSRVPGGVRT
jgi:hypothetical protein